VTKFLIIFFILNFYSSTQASIKNKIIFKLKKTNNLSFNFKQTIDNKNEEGNCIIKYPKKIYCEYSNFNKKTIISNGKFLVIKKKNNKNFNFYPLKRTAFEFLLDKDYLIKKIINLNPREVNNKYLNFTIFENNNEINIFFDKKTFNLVGWQTIDVYQNLIITFISSVVINQKIDDKIFILPVID
jgi:outer membrane lipoprotein-sorting protein